MSQRLDNFLSVVTGASQGNGKAIANALEKNGSYVVGVDIKECVGNSKNFRGDVCDLQFIKTVFDYCEKQEFESIVLINNAGITLPSNYPYPVGDWDRTLAVNLTAPFCWIESFIPIFERVKSGAIINITSLGAERAFPNNPAYIASKGGLKMLTKYYAKALGEHGIRANNVGPGYIVTEMVEKSFSDQQQRKIRENHTLLDRWGQSQEVADACVFLASNESRYITGQDIYVDGGWLANGLVK